MHVRLKNWSELHYHCGLVSVMIMFCGYKMNILLRHVMISSRQSILGGVKARGKAKF